MAERLGFALARHIALMPARSGSAVCRRHVSLSAVGVTDGDEMVGWNRACVGCWHSKLLTDGMVAPALKMTLVDRWHLPAGRQRGYCFTGSDVAAKITMHFSDSATFGYSQFHGTVDLFFIEGAHFYEYVRSDTENALPCYRPGGVTAWHDYGRLGVNGVSKWLHEPAETRGVYCVPGGSLAYMSVE